MKQIFLAITLFSILAVLPVNYFGQQPQGDPDALITQMGQEFTAKKYAEAIETATKALSYSFKSPIKKALVYEFRARSLNNLYFLKGKTIYTDYTFKYSPVTIEKLKLAVSDFGEVINFFKQNPPTNDSVAISRNSVYSTAANIYWSLGQYSSHNPADFAKAEELFKLALPTNKNPNWINFRIALCLAGQYKFYEARELAKRVLAAETENEFDVTLKIIVEAFDSMGEYQFSDAFLLEQAGIRKVASKSLKPISEVGNSRKAVQKASLEFTNPTTVMELNRKGALLAITQQCDKAVPILEKTVNVNNSPTAARFLIQCLMIQQKFDFAWDISNNLLDFDKNDVIGLSFRAILLTMQDGEEKAKAEKAEADLSKAISVFPELASFYNGLENAKKIYQFQNKPNKVNEIAALEKKFSDINGEITKEIEKENNEKRSLENAKAYLEEMGGSSSLDEEDVEFEVLAERFLEDAIKPAALSFKSFTEEDPDSDKDGIKTYDLSFETLAVSSTETITLFYGYKPGTKKIINIEFSSSFDENAILKSINRIGEKYKKNGSDSKVIKKTIDNKTAYDLEISKITRIRFTPEAKTLLIYGN